MSKKQKLLILIPDGTGIKNYLLSDFLKFAHTEFDLVLAHNFDKNIEPHLSLKPNQYKKVNIPVYNENSVHKFYREALCFARLNYNAKIKKNPSILVNWRRDFKNFFKKTFYKLVELYGFFLFKEYRRIERATNTYHKKVRKSESIQGFIDLLKQEQPDVVMTTHQRSTYNIPLFAAAKKLNITSVSVIYSWDNMPKARIPYYSDYFMVWSEYMKSEFQDYYPEIDLNSVKITGTPQFEFYLDSSIIKEKSEFCKEHGLDTNKPIICFSGDDRLTSPFDPEYLDDMVAYFSEIEESIRPQIILRPSPADDGSRFKPVLEKYPTIKFAPADWYESDGQKHWAVKFPKRSDIYQLVNLTYHADAVVNLGSTMAHDFAMFKKPAFYLNYRPDHKQYTELTPRKEKWNIQTIYKYEHFKSMQNLNPVFWINQISDFSKIMNKINKFDKNVKRDQKLWRDKIIGESLYKNASQNLTNTIKKLN